MEGNEPLRCRCGTILSRYNPDYAKPGAICAVCEVRAAEARLQRLENGNPRPPRVQCRMPGCPKWATARSAETTSHRWKNLCDLHYDVQRQVVSDGMRRRHAKARLA